MAALNRFLRDESGLESGEWAFVPGFVILTAVIAFIGARGYLSTIFTEMGTELDQADDLSGSQRRRRKRPGPRYRDKGESMFGGAGRLAMC